MKVSELIKALADWSPDTDVIVTPVGGHYMESEEYEVESVAVESDNFDRVQIIVSPAEMD